MPALVAGINVFKFGQAIVYELKWRNGLAMLPSSTSSALALRVWGGVGGGGAFFAFCIRVYPHP
jgi:hypothetical protein